MLILFSAVVFFFFFQAEDGILDAQDSRGLGDVYKRQPGNIGYCKAETDSVPCGACHDACPRTGPAPAPGAGDCLERLPALALIHI